MKKNEIRTELGGLGQSKGKGFLIYGELGGEEDRGGFAPPVLNRVFHGNLPMWIFLG
jgi:hypothetical protein